MRESRRAEAAGDRRGDRLAGGADLLGVERLDAAAVDRTLGSVLKYERGPGGRSARPASSSSCAAVTDAALRPFGVETIELDLPPLAGAFSRRLHDAGVP